MPNNKFATVITCMDGRIQLPVNEWIRKTFNVDYVDTITMPGPNKVMAKGYFGEMDSIRQKVRISIKAHGSSVLAIVGHYDCAGNPVSKEEIVKQIQTNVIRIKDWGLPVDVVGLWVNDRWEVETVAECKRRTAG